jgi:TRAP-type mannitol/chloroaromatic compound transport system substrate-binding protein
MQAKYDARNPAALKRLVAAGVQLRPFPKSMADASLAAAEQLYAELSDKNPRWKKIFASYDRFRRDAIMWSRFSDGAFDSYMATTINRKNPA